MGISSSSCRVRDVIIIIVARLLFGDLADDAVRDFEAAADLTRPHASLVQQHDLRAHLVR